MALMCSRRAWRSTRKNKLSAGAGVLRIDILKFKRGLAQKISCGKKAAKIFIVVNPFMLRLLERRPTHGRDQIFM